VITASKIPVNRPAKLVHFENLLNNGLRGTLAFYQTRIYCPHLGKPLGGSEFLDLLPCFELTSNAERDLSL
jgi:hypothetical protein